MRGRAGDQPRPGEGARGDAEHHAPEAVEQDAEARAGKKLPEVRHQRRHEEQRRGLDGRHQEAEKAHGDGRQAKADHAPDQPGKKERARDEQCGGDEIGHPAMLRPGSLCRNAGIA